MTEVADGNPVTMSATQEITSLDTPEGFVSSGLSPCSNDSLKTPVVNTVDPDAELQVGAGESNIPPASLEEVAVSAEERGDDLEAPQDNQDVSNEESALNAPDAAAMTISSVEISTVETTTIETSVVETSAVIVEAHATDISTLETNTIVTSTVETYSVESPAEEVNPVGESAPSSGGEAEDLSIKDTEQESLPNASEEGRQDVISEATAVTETTLTAAQDVDKSENGVTKMDEAVDHTISLSANPVVNDTIETAEDMGEKQGDEATDRMGSKFTGGVADRMADAIADEIADQIADRMADEIADKMADEMAGGIADDMADEMADRMADEMADRMADEMADRMADEMADRMADEMAAEMADELADEMADEVIEGEYGRSEGAHENDGRMDDGEAHEVGDMEEEEEMAEDVNKVIDDDEYEDDEGTPDEQMAFVEELERFFKQRNLEYKAPKFYGLELNVLKLWRVVSKYGGYDHVTVSKLWRTVGEEFKPPKTCTTISWSFRGFYEKALLDYERFKTGVSAPDSSQRAIQTTGFYLANEQRTASPATPSSEPNMGGTPGSGSGRARRDAAARAMQGWHSQRLGNGDAKEPNPPKEKGSGGKHVKKEKKLTNIGGNGLKRKGSNLELQRAVKAVQARGRPRLYEDSPPSNSAVTGKRTMKQQDSGRRPMKVAKVDGPVGGFDPPIVDEGPKADWVKINVHKHLDCFEIYALVPGLAREEVRIQCEPGGRLVIAGMPEDPENPWGVTPFRKVISLPSRIDAHQTSAVVTLYGQLYVRVPIAEDKSS